MKRFFICAVFCGLLCSFLSLNCFAVSDKPAADVWDGVSVTEPTRITTIDGDDYYQIYTCAELAHLIQTERYLWETPNISLENDLIINDVTLLFDENGNCLNAEDLHHWSPIKQLDGIFQGNGHTISGIYMVGNDYGVGFISELQGGSVYDLNIINSYIENQSAYVGAICGAVEVYTNCNYSDDTYWGEVSNIRNCSFDGVIRGTVGVGGLIGRIWTNGENNYADPATFPSCTVSDCQVSGYIVETDSYTGGIVGVVSGKWATVAIKDCLNLTDISADNEVGGILGQLLIAADINAVVENCVNKGNIFASTQTAGGVVGVCQGGGNTFIQYCVNEGSVTSGGSTVGGIVGRLSTQNSTRFNAYYQDKNVAPGRHEVRFCVNNGDISGNGFVGGLLGAAVPRHEGSLLFHDSYSTGGLTSTSSVSPLVGALRLYPDSTYSMTRCYSVGLLSGSKPGGLAGDIDYYEGCTTPPQFESCRWLNTMTSRTVGLIIFLPCLQRSAARQ